MARTVFADASLVLPEGVVRGALVVEDGRIARIVEAGADGDVTVDTDEPLGAGRRGPADRGRPGPESDRGREGRADAARVEHLDGDFLLPGLVEPHTDNVERHLLPRPSARWPNALAALLAHDAEIAASGITTVCDSLRVGSHEGEREPRGELFAAVAETLARHAEALRVEHRLHIRCELTDPRLPETLEPFVDDPRVALLSLMDHTPGQRQWRDIEALRRHKSAPGGTRDAASIEREIAERLEAGQRHVVAVRARVLERVAARVAARSLVLASHDDTTVEHVEQAAAEGISIAEFPCTIEAARAASAHGLATLGGAPNLVRGGSHSGNVAVRDLARAGVLDGLSSDYVPASTLQAVFALVAEEGWTLADAVALASAAPADMLGLADRGRLRAGLRADLVRVALVGDTPRVRAVHVGGRRVA